MTCRVYLAGASRELPRVLKMVNLLEASGLVVITHRWFDAVQAWGIGKDAELTLDQRRTHALTDFRGVDTADVFWCLWPEKYSHGCALELGYALGRNFAATVVSGKRAHECIFTSLAQYQDSSDDHGLVEVLRMAKAQRDLPRRP